MSHRRGEEGTALDRDDGSMAGRWPVRALDPRSRILAAGAFSVATVALESLLLLLIPLGMAGAALLASGQRIRPTLARVVMMEGFIVVLLVLLPFTVPGPQAFTVLGWPASWAGIEQALGIALKANAIVLMLLSLVGSMDPTTLGHALARLRMPETLVHLLLFTVRYISVVDEEYRRQRRAMKARGFRPGTNLHTFRSFGYLIGMLLVRALERSERILKAMKCRGFTGRLPLLTRLQFHSRDAVFGVALAMTLLGVLALDALRVSPV